ncbi:MAG TPA: threonine-phosphate decarboxylase CobD [Bacillota bacterium]|nr:threonine-phosphate decarboxylase CobD [Bacillota bacterium]
MKRFEHVHGGNIARASVKYGIPKDKLIDFSASINPLGPSKKMIEAVLKNLKYIKNYPDPECRELKSALAAYLCIDEDFLVFGNGAAELIYLIVRVTGCKKAIIPVPTFCEYGLAVLSSGGKIIEILTDERDRFRLPVEKIEDQMPQADMLFLCNPNNPTGRVVHKRIIERVVRKAETHGVMVVVDEAFMDFVAYKENYSCTSMLEKYGNIALLYSMTKFFGIPGLRLGALAAPRDLAAVINTSKDPWNVNILAQAAGTAGLRDKNFIKETKKVVMEEKRFLFKGLSGIDGIKPLPGAANFMLVNIAETGFKSCELTELLGRKGILVRDCAGFKGLEEGYLRIAVKRRQENEMLLDSLREITEGNK